MTELFSMAALSAVFGLGLIAAVIYLTRKGRCAKGEDHFICIREWLKASTPFVALFAASFAAIGGWIALQNLAEVQMGKLERAANVDRLRIAAIMSEKEAFLKVYRSDFLRTFFRKWENLNSLEMTAIELKEQLEGLGNVKRQDETWLSSQYAVGPASVEIGKARHAFDRVTANLVNASIDVIEAYSDVKNKNNIRVVNEKITHAVDFYNKDFLNTCDSYWDALDKEMIRLHAEIIDFDRRAF